METFWRIVHCKKKAQKKPVTGKIDMLDPQSTLLERKQSLFAMLLRWNETAVWNNGLVVLSFVCI